MGGDVVRDAFGVVAMVAMTPLITIQILGVLYVRRETQSADRSTGVEYQVDIAELFAEYEDDEIIEF